MGRVFAEQSLSLDRGVRHISDRRKPAGVTISAATVSR